jgi:hypothetical protein
MAVVDAAVHELPLQGGAICVGDFAFTVVLAAKPLASVAAAVEIRLFAVAHLAAVYEAPDICIPEVYLCSVSVSQAVSCVSFVIAAAENIKLLLLFAHSVGVKGHVALGFSPRYQGNDFNLAAWVVLDGSGENFTGKEDW